MPTLKGLLQSFLGVFGCRLPHDADTKAAWKKTMACMYAHAPNQKHAGPAAPNVEDDSAVAGCTGTGEPEESFPVLHGCWFIAELDKGAAWEDKNGILKRSQIMPET